MVQLSLLTGYALSSRIDRWDINNWDTLAHGRQLNGILELHCIRIKT